MSSQNFLPLDPSIIRQALKGVESQGERIQKANQSIQDSILQSKCPHCSGGLLPRLPRNPDKVFNSEALRFEAWCPTCREIRPYPLGSGA